MPADPQARYTRGQIISIDVVLTAHHMGHFEFSACPIKQGGVATGNCFKQYRLKFVSDPLYGAPKDPNYPYRAYIAPPGRSKQQGSGLLYRFRVKLPDNLTGDLVLLQWHYFTANSCIYPGYNSYPYPADWNVGKSGQGICNNIPADGRGLPGAFSDLKSFLCQFAFSVVLTCFINTEQFWNCAEISISGSPVSSTNKSPVRRTPVRRPTRRPTGKPAANRNIRLCGGGVIGIGVCPTASHCCSKFGYCGSGSAYCSASSRANRTPTRKPQSGRRDLATATCGGGSVGNGVCPNGLCCSKWGFCGSDASYCSQSCGQGSIGNGKCADSSLCCSKHGYCGRGSEYCGTTSASNRMPTRKPIKRPTTRPASPVRVTAQDSSRGSCGGGKVGNGKCPNSGLCCSKWGYCGIGSEFCGSTAVESATSPTGTTSLAFPKYADGGCSGMNNVMRVNVGYYQSWAMSRQNGCNPVSPDDIDVSGNGYTHLIYTFASINSNFQLEPWDGDYTTEVSKFRAFTNLKKTNPNLKTLIAVGGWTFNDPGPTLTRFSDTASTAARRAAFAKSCVDFCRTYNFDGVDLDWEYPGDASRGGNSADKSNYVQLVKAIRSAFDDADEDLQLTMAIPVASFRLQDGYNLPALANNDGVNFFNLMTYDLYGAWDNPKVVGANTDMPYIFDAVEYILNTGVSSNKLVLGLAAYGRTYNLEDSSCTTAGCPFSSGGLGGCAGATGFMPYFTIDNYVRSGNYKSKRYNPITGTMELVINSNVLVSYDSPRTMRIKHKFASQACLRGVMWWAVDMKKDPIVLDNNR